MCACVAKCAPHTHTFQKVMCGYWMIEMRAQIAYSILDFWSGSQSVSQSASQQPDKIYISQHFFEYAVNTVLSYSWYISYYEYMVHVYYLARSKMPLQSEAKNKYAWTDWFPTISNAIKIFARFLEIQYTTMNIEHAHAHMRVICMRKFIYYILFCFPV